MPTAEGTASRALELGASYTRPRYNYACNLFSMPRNVRVHLSLRGNAVFWSDTQWPRSLTIRLTYRFRHRFHARLNVPTALARTAGEIPATYLNKGQAYSVSVTDMAPTKAGPIPGQYRTSIRISFEDWQQGKALATRWQIWKEGLGAVEALQRGAELHGVEYIAAKQVAGDGRKDADVRLERASVDGFSSSGIRDQMARPTATSLCDLTSPPQPSVTVEASRES
jgi:hypothetical protein